MRATLRRQDELLVRAKMRALSDGHIREDMNNSAHRLLQLRAGIVRKAFGEPERRMASTTHQLPCAHPIPSRGDSEFYKRPLETPTYACMLCQAAQRPRRWPTDLLKHPSSKNVRNCRAIQRTLTESSKARPAGESRLTQ